MLDRITIFCFAASYGGALLFEALQLFFGVTAWRRVLALVFAAAGLFAHTVFVIYHVLPLQSGANTLLFLSWILAVFYLIGSLHHVRQAWGVFVLPVVLVLVLVSMLAVGTDADTPPTPPELWPWLWLHVALLILGSVGLCVGFVASVMYLVQSWKLKHKAAAGRGGATLEPGTPGDDESPRDHAGVPAVYRRAARGRCPARGHRAAFLA